MEEKNYDDVEETTTENSPEEEATEDTTEGSEATEEESQEEIDWQARALKAEKAIEKAKKKQKSEPKESVEDLTLARLEARGVLNQDDQEYVLKYAKVEGINPIEALQDEFVQERLKANERTRKSAQATPKGNNRAGTSTDDVNIWVKRYKQNGSLPEGNPALTAKVLDALTNGA